MSDQWMPLIQLPITIEQFRQLPRNPAYKYEYLDGKAWLTLRGKHYHAVLDLRPVDVAEPVDVRPLRAEDFDRLVAVFAGAFRTIQPFGSLDDDTRWRAAREALERTRAGGDGPWIERASFVAWEDGRPVGSIWVTLLPEGDSCDFESYYWRQPPPPDCVSARLGRPHLTWIFVSPLYAGRGIGTALLAAVAPELLASGYGQLYSTFMSGNESSLLWHWRSGFRLLAYPGSYRLMRQRFQEYRAKGSPS